MGRPWGTPAQSGAPDGEALHARLRRMIDRKLEQEIARLEVEAARGRGVYLPAEDAETG